MAGGDGALAVYIMPRYVLHNTLEVPVQYKQQGTKLDRELKPGAARAVHWADAMQPLRLCVRMHEAGWQWSGGVSLDTPGDLFLKIRHKWVLLSRSAVGFQPRKPAAYSR